MVPSARKPSLLSAGGNFGVVTNVNELEAMLSHIDEKLPLIIAQAVDSIMEKVRQSTQRELFKHIGQGQIPNAPRQIAFAIKSEEIRYDQARNEITGRFFVDGRGKGVLTARDDDGNRFNVAKALEEGMAAQMVYFIGFSSRGRFGGAKKGADSSEQSDRRRDGLLVILVVTTTRDSLKWLTWRTHNWSSRTCWNRRFKRESTTHMVPRRFTERGEQDGDCDDESILDKQAERRRPSKSGGDEQQRGVLGHRSVPRLPAAIESSQTPEYSLTPAVGSYTILACISYGTTDPDNGEVLMALDNGTHRVEVQATGNIQTLKLVGTSTVQTEYLDLKMLNERPVPVVLRLTLDSSGNGRLYMREIIEDDDAQTHYLSVTGSASTSREIAWGNNTGTVNWSSVCEQARSIWA